MAWRPDWDALALRALQDNDQEELDRLDKLSRCSIGKLCPECGATTEITSGSDNQSFRCRQCEHQWDAAGVAAEAWS